MAKQAMRCSECSGLMELRLGQWECQNCRHTVSAQEAAEENKQSRASPQDSSVAGSLRSSSKNWQKEQGTHLLDFSKGSGRKSELTSGRHRKQITPQVVETTEFTKRETGETKFIFQQAEGERADHLAQQRLALEKHVYFGLWLILSAYVCYTLVMYITQGQYSTTIKLHEVIYIAVFCSAVMIGVMWYTLYCQEAWVKWLFVIIGCLTFLTQTVFFFALFTNETLVTEVFFDAGYSGVMGGITAAVLTVCWTGWYVFILWRDAKVLSYE